MSHYNTIASMQNSVSIKTKYCQAIVIGLSGCTDSISKLHYIDLTELFQLTKTHYLQTHLWPCFSKFCFLVLVILLYILLNFAFTQHHDENC